jgi:hypothetical protein
VGGATQVHPGLKNVHKFMKKKEGHATGTTNLCIKSYGCDTSGTKTYAENVVTDKIKACKIISRCLQGGHRCGAIVRDASDICSAD